MSELGWDELSYLEYIKDKISPAPVLIDVGANIGDFTAEWLRRFPAGSAFCFEPIKEIFEQLAARLVYNPHIQVCNFGLHSQPLEKEMYYVKNSSGMSSLYDRPEHWPRFDVVKSKGLFSTLDIINEWLPQEIDYLKIDVEGDELAVLQGGVELLKSGRVHFIQWECGGCWYDSQTKLIDAINLLNPYYMTYMPDLTYTVIGHLHRMTLNIITPDNCPPTFWEAGDKFTVVNMLSERREK